MAVPELSDEERPAPNDGAYGRELVVPEDMEGGHLLCQQGFVYGVFARGGYTLTSSPRVCFTTEAAPPPTRPHDGAADDHDHDGAHHDDDRPPEPPGWRPARRSSAPAPVPVQDSCRRPVPHDRLLLIGAGGALAMGGLAVAAGARRTRRAADRRRLTARAPKRSSVRKCRQMGRAPTSRALSRPGEELRCGVESWPALWGWGALVWPCWRDDARDVNRAAASPGQAAAAPASMADGGHRRRLRGRVDEHAPGRFRRREADRRRRRRRDGGARRRHPLAPDLGSAPTGRAPSSTGPWPASG